MRKKPYIDYEDDESELIYPETYSRTNRRVGMRRRMNHKTKAVTENGMRRLRARQIITLNPSPSFARVERSGTTLNP